MIRVNPYTPAYTMMAAITISEMSLTATLSFGPPSSPTTVEIAKTESTVSTVSQPTVSSHEITDTSRLPLTPNAARLSTMVGAEPRRPASEMKPQNRNEIVMPMMATIVACQNEMPKPIGGDDEHDGRQHERGLCPRQHPDPEPVEQHTAEQSPATDSEVERDRD